MNPTAGTLNRRRTAEAACI